MKVVGALLVLAADSAAVVPADDTVARALADELARSQKELRLGDEPQPYFVAYALTDIDTVGASATFGALTTQRQGRWRTLRVDLRVGDPTFDNSNFEGSPFGVRGGAMPIEDEYAALRREIWRRTDEAYKQAVEALARKRASARSQVEADDAGVPDFAAQPPMKIVAPGKPGAPDPERLRGTLEALAGVFRSFPGIQSSRVDGEWTRTRRRFVSTEGTSTDESRSLVRVTAVAETQAPDGMPLKSFVTFTGATSEDLPAPPVLEKAVRRMAEELAAMRLAPVVESGSATVLFEGAAAPQIVKLLLGDQVSGTPPPKSGGDGGADPPEWSTKLGQKVAASRLSVVDDPGIAAVGRLPLYGAYRADDEGVPPKRVTVVKDGVLGSLLMTRTPRKEIARSNGHGRTGLFGAPSGRIGNLFVTASGGVGRPALLAELARAAREPGTTAYVVRLLDDGLAPGSASDDLGALRFSMGRGGAQAVRPLVVYRLRGGKEELVRGLTLEGLQPRSFKDVVAAGRDPVAWNVVDPPAGLVGVPSSVITPALVFRDVDVRRVPARHRKPPPYPHPAFAGR